MSAPAKDGLKLTEEQRRGYGDKIRAFLCTEQVSLFCELYQQVEYPVAIFTGGQPGSGKTTAVVNSLRKRFIDADGIAVVDPDGLREQFPESALEMARGGGRFSDAALAGSGTLAHEICMSLAAQRRHFVHEGTLASLEHAGPEMDALRAKGYAVEVHVAAVYPDLSLARTVIRSELDADQSPTGFGRSVPKAVHDAMAARIPDCLDALWASRRVDRIAIYSRHGEVVFDSLLKGGAWSSPQGTAAQAEGPGAVVRAIHAQPDAADQVEALRRWIDAMDWISSADRHPNAPTESPPLVERQLSEAFKRVAADEGARTLLAEDTELQARLIRYV